MPEPLTLQLLSSSSFSSTHSTVENHLVSPGPRSSLAAVVCRQCAAVMFDSALVTRFPHVTRGVNANEAQERQLAAARRLLRLRPSRLMVANSELVYRPSGGALSREHCRGVLPC